MLTPEQQRQVADFEREHPYPLPKVQTSVLEPDEVAMIRRYYPPQISAIYQALEPQHEPLAGKRFGRLQVVSETLMRQSRKIIWLCHCDCGKYAYVTRTDLQTGHTQSCGCLHREQTGRIKLSHGQSRVGKTSSLYMRWAQMIQRCNNPDHPRFKDYGGRGITVCARWLAFENFAADMGEPPAGMMLDRENNDGNYEPGNCRWVTQLVSARNTRNKKKPRSPAI